MDFARASAETSDEAVEEDDEEEDDAKEEEEEEEEDSALRFHTVPSSTSKVEVDSVVSTTRMLSSNVSRVTETSMMVELVDSEEPSSAGGAARTRVAVRSGRRSLPETRRNSDLWATSAPEGATRRRDATPGRRRASALASGTLGASADIDAMSRVLVRWWARDRRTCNFRCGGRSSRYGTTHVEAARRSTLSCTGGGGIKTEVVWENS
jgi:hypothetical protein